MAFYLYSTPTSEDIQIPDSLEGVVLESRAELEAVLADHDFSLSTGSNEDLDLDGGTSLDIHKVHADGSYTEIVFVTVPYHGELNPRRLQWRIRRTRRTFTAA